MEKVERTGPSGTNDLRAILTRPTRKNACEVFAQIIMRSLYSLYLRAFLSCAFNFRAFQKIIIYVFIFRVFARIHVQTLAWPKMRKIILGASCVDSASKLGGFSVNKGKNMV